MKKTKNEKQEREYKVLSHAEMMMNPRHHNVHVEKNLDKPYEVNDYTNEVVRGVATKKRVVVVESPSERFKGMSATDFALENIIAVGALGQLKTTQLSDGIAVNACDRIGVSVDAIIDAVDREIENNNLEKIEE